MKKFLVSDSACRKRHQGSGITSWQFTVSNGTSFSNLTALINAYNYKAYMPQLQCSNVACIPLAICTVGCEHRCAMQRCRDHGREFLGLL